MLFEPKEWLWQLGIFGLPEDLSFLCFHLLFMLFRCSSGIQLWDIEQIQYVTNVTLLNAAFKRTESFVLWFSRNRKLISVSSVMVLLTAERHGPAGQGYCQGGFSADFTKVRENI